MKASDYDKRIIDILIEMKNDEDITYQEMIAFIPNLAKQSIENVERLAGAMAPMILEHTLGIRR